MITMQNNARYNLSMQGLIYESKNGFKLIWKCMDGTWWWKPWMHERRRLEDRSSPQQVLVFKLLKKSLSKPTT